MIGIQMAMLGGLARHANQRVQRSRDSEKDCRRGRTAFFPCSVQKAVLPGVREGMTAALHVPNTCLRTATCCSSSRLVLSRRCTPEV